MDQFMPHVRPLLHVLTILALGASVLAFSGAGSPAGAVTAGSPYTAVTPTRILDTRAGTGAPRAAVAPNGRVVLTVVGGQVPSGVTAAVLNVTVTQPTARTGYVTVWADQQSKPTASNINFVRGQTVPNLVVAPVSADGKVDLFNGSIGTIQLVADVSGYFAGSTPVDQGMFGSISPTRVLDTRSGAAVGAGKVVTATVTGHGVPADASAVVVNLTVTQPTAATGDATAYPAGGSRPTASNVNFVRGQTVANLAVVPVGAGGKISLYNHSGGTVQFIADVSGYFLGGDPVDAGGFGALAPARLLDTRRSGGPVAAGATAAVSVWGRAGIPLADVRAVVLNVTVTQPTRAGVVTVYAGGTPRPAVSNLNFGAGQTVPNLVVAPVGADGKVLLYNGSIGSVQLIADVSGYVLNQDAPLPDPASRSHYVRNLTGNPTNDYAAMKEQGQADAAARSTLVLLDIGAQLNDKSGVALSVVETQITYAALVNAVQGYLDGFGAVPGATVAVATNNGADNWTAYTAQQRGADWANKVVDLLTPGTGVSVVGANDIEASFFSTQQQAADWEQAYLSVATVKKLIFNGSADGCPTTYGATGQTCAFGWTQAQYYALAGGNDPRIAALPQIYYDTQAVQWGNIDATGGKNIHFAGALTEHNAACGADCAMTPQQGWAALYHALSTVMAPSLPAVTDLDILS
jgi:hypothetical protein